MAADPKKDTLAALQSGALDDHLAEVRRAIDARMSSPAYRGRKPVSAADRGLSLHCGGREIHPPHYHTNPFVQNPLTALPVWCIGTS